MTTRLSGLGVSPGSASAPMILMSPPPELGPEPSTPVADLDVEMRQALDALEAVGADLDERGARVSGDAADVLMAQSMIARDPGLSDLIIARIKEGRHGPYAVWDAFGHFRGVLAAAGPYLAQRVADLDDIRDRAVAIMLGQPMPGVPHPGHQFILVARDLAPADTATLDPSEVVAIVTAQGGPTSHTAILAKSLGIPAVVACSGLDAVSSPAAGEAGTRAYPDGTVLLVDGSTGTVDIRPDPAAVAHARAREQRRREASGASSGPGRTADGHAIGLLVNLGGSEDLDAVTAVGADGVGLFRTEFLFLDRPEEPGIGAQQAVYARVFAAFGGRKVVVRTLDAGADKPLQFATIPDEPNPALGVRGLRTSRHLPDLLDRQLSAIAAAASGSTADVWVMAPMVSTAAEATGFAGLAHRHGLSTAGVMVEVPAAGCDFMSIGTNDLAQYTFAADRMAGELADLLDPWQPALLDLVRLTAEAGARTGKPVGVCGEAASDPLLALVLVGLGVGSLSMAPVCIGDVRVSVAARTLTECRELAALALAAPDAVAARAAVRDAVSALD